METVKALKEWAVTVKALAEGRQLLVMRKGGIREKRFDVDFESFYLYPTYEHQAPELLKPEFLPNLEETLRAAPPPETLLVPCWAQVTDLYELREEEHVLALSPYHIWADEYLLKRLHWRPKQPLTVMLLRVYRLERPVALPLLPEYVGCFSWVDLPAAALDGLPRHPVLDDAEFAARAAPLRSLLAGMTAPAR
ncbi:MAG: DUF1802 family protein [Dehalococcoidia bacterium]|jgi:hypothetical protein|nr:DUF1802 family protein [Dehalococcoidia bacterium]MDW8009770.1 DUF1802 family protein [Chloroflexota bacterium]